MQCEVCTYQPNVKHYVPSFCAKRVKVDWSSESGKLIEKALLGLAVITAATCKEFGKNADGTPIYIWKDTDFELHKKTT